METKRLQEIEKIKYAVNFEYMRHKWFQIKNMICLQSAHTFASLRQTGYFLLPKETSSFSYNQSTDKLHQHEMKFHCVALFAKCKKCPMTAIQLECGCATSETRN